MNPDWENLERFAFGDSSASADELLDLVIAGPKRATCWSIADGQQTEIGKRMIVLNGSGNPGAVIETIELAARRFCDVDRQFAFDEGEGDRTLEQWQADHQAYFTRNGGFDPAMMLWCERFRLIEVIGESDAT